MDRNHTRVVKIGDVCIGGGNRIAIQSMTNTKTEDVEATVSQILELEKAGCDIVRCTVPTMEAAKALSIIKSRIHIPLVADIHFDYKMAIAAIENGADKIRINPGNMNLFFNLFDRFCCLHCRNCTADDLTSCFFQTQDLLHCGFYIFCPCICHRLDCNRVISSDHNIPNSYFFRLISVHDLYPLFPLLCKFFLCQMILFSLKFNLV